jgi:hypothetical protein
MLMTLCISQKTVVPPVKILFAVAACFTIEVSTTKRAETWFFSLMVIFMWAEAAGEAEN